MTDPNNYGPPPSHHEAQKGIGDNLFLKLLICKQPAYENYWHLTRDENEKRYFKGKIDTIVEIIQDFRMLK